MADWYWDAATSQSQALYADRDGSLAKPWVLGPNRFGINAGAMDLSVFGAGDTLWIRDHHAWANFTDQAVFSNVANLTIRGDYPGRPGRVAFLGLNTVSDVVVQSLEMQNIGLGTANGVEFNNLYAHDGAYAFRMIQEDSADFITLQGCTFHNFTHEGIEVFTRVGSTRDHWTIIDNHIYNIGLNPASGVGDREGIGVQRLTNSLIAGNRIHDCCYGINLWESGEGVTHNVEISDNIVHSIVGGASSWPSRGIMMSGGSTTAGSVYDISVTDNVVYTTGKEGIRLQAPSGATGLSVNGNVVIDPNIEFGTPDSEFLVAPAEWQRSNNRFYPVYRSYNRARAGGNYTRSWSL